jgi:Beta-lactamase enzyme family
VRAPAGTARADLFAGGRFIASRRVARRGVVFRLRLLSGRYDVAVRFRGEDGAVLGRRRSRAAWLLPPAAAHGRRERWRDGVLTRRLGRIGRSFGGWAGLWTHDLTTGRTAGWNADAVFPAASTVKLAVLVAALRRFGPRPERSPAWTDIRDLATWSSNVASNRLLLRLGGSEAGGSRIAQGVLWRLGARSSTFTGFYRLGTARAAAQVATDRPRPLPFVASRRTTAHDLGRILLELHLAALGDRRALARTQLSRHEARVGLGLLLSSDRTGSNRGLFASAFAPGLSAAQKQGWTASVRHTAAIVYGPGGPRIAVLLTYQPAIRAQAAAALGRRFLQALGFANVRSG